MIVGTNWGGGDALIISVVIATNDSMKVLCLKYHHQQQTYSSVSCSTVFMGNPLLRGWNFFDYAAMRTGVGIFALK